MVLLVLFFFFLMVFHLCLEVPGKPFSSVFLSWNTLGHLEGQVDIEVMVFFVRNIFLSRIMRS